MLLTAAMFTTGRSADFFHVRKPPFPIAGYAASCPEGSFEWRLLPSNFSARMLFFLLHKYTFNREYTRFSSYEYYMSEGYPRVWFCTSPTDSLLHTHTRRMHEFMKENGIQHEYREYASKTRKLDHVFNVLHPEYPESIQANEDIVRFFLEELINQASDALNSVFERKGSVSRLYHLRDDRDNRDDLYDTSAGRHGCNTMALKAML